jgi:bifunctional non-homologous end joining protein LigD
MDASPSAVAPAKLPAFRKPQRAILAAKPPAGDGWIYELKYDGYRCLAAIAGREVKLYTRRGLNWTKQFGFVVPELRQLTKGSLLLDGEIVAFDAKGKPSFSELQAALGSGGPISYIAFDLLEQDGKDLIRLPQVKRKALLEAALGPQPRPRTCNMPPTSIPASKALP